MQQLIENSIKEKLEHKMKMKMKILIIKPHFNMCVKVVFALKKMGKLKKKNPTKKVKCTKDQLFPTIYLRKIMKKSSYEVDIIFL